MDTKIDGQHFGLWRAARIFASVLILMTAMYYLVVAFDNITNPGSNWDFVKGVISGDGTPTDDGFEWRAIDATWFSVIAYIAIIAGETLAGVMLLYAGVQGLRKSKSHEPWSRQQPMALLGCALGLAVFYFGFITVGGNWFIMYLNDTWNGLDPAFQNTVTTLATAAVVMLVAMGGRLARQTGETEAASAERAPDTDTATTPSATSAPEGIKEKTQPAPKGRHGLAR